MLVFALVAALMVGLQRDFTLTLQRGTHQLFSEQAWAYLIGAEELAAWHCRQTVAPTPEPSRHGPPGRALGAASNTLSTGRRWLDEWAD
ncbi:MAG: hypothetical protein CM15mP89_1760 [Gammaproteobacteria bacterium]|nr:MAG: hypothetical protein CM15mP89_1760 [Gammaproteobacteria bacterium]